jgi:hypothetical protein
VSILTSPVKPSRAAAARPSRSPPACGSAPGRHVGTRHRQRARFAAAAVGELDRLPISWLTTLMPACVLHRRVAGLVVQVAAPLTPSSLTPFSSRYSWMSSRRQPGKILPNWYFSQLVHAGAAGDDDRLDVEVVERVGDAVEEHAVVGGDLLALVGLAGGGLRVAAAQVARRQHGLRADLVEHRLGGQADLREQALRAAAGEVEHRVAVVVRRADLLRIADDRDDLVVLDVEQRARRALGQPARHRLVDEVDDLRADRSANQRGRRLPRLRPGSGRTICQPVARRCAL